MFLSNQWKKHNVKLKLCYFWVPLTFSPYSDCIQTGSPFLPWNKNKKDNCNFLSHNSDCFASQFWEKYSYSVAETSFHSKVVSLQAILYYIHFLLWNVYIQYWENSCAEYTHVFGNRFVRNAWTVFFLHRKTFFYIHSTSYKFHWQALLILPYCLLFWRI